MTAVAIPRTNLARQVAKNWWWLWLVIFLASCILLLPRIAPWPPLTLSTTQTVWLPNHAEIVPYVQNHLEGSISGIAASGNTPALALPEIGISKQELEESHRRFPYLYVSVEPSVYYQGQWSMNYFGQESLSQTHFRTYKERLAVPDVVLDGYSIRTAWLERNQEHEGILSVTYAFSITRMIGSWFLWISCIGLSLWLVWVILDDILRNRKNSDWYRWRSNW